MKTKISFLIVILFCSFSNYAQTDHPFIHYATTQNILLTNTTIDHPSLNNNPNANIFVQKVRVYENNVIVNNPDPIGVRYLNDKWIIYNESFNDFQPDSCYMIHIGSPNTWRHKTGSGTILPGFDNVSVMNYTALNDVFNASIMFTKLQDSDGIINKQPIESYYGYTSLKWNVSTPPGQPIPEDSAFNIAKNPAGFLFYEHGSTSGNIGSEVNSVTDYAYWTILDHVLLNNNPNALLFVNHRREPSTSFIYKDFSVFYNSVTGKWQLHIELESYISGFSFPIGNLFNIFIWDGTLDTSEFNITDNLKVYPNPSNSVFTVEAKQNISNVSVFNVIGQKLNEFSYEGNNKLQIDMSAYESGNYFAKIKAGEFIDTVRLLKN